MREVIASKLLPASRHSRKNKQQKEKAGHYKHDHNAKNSFCKQKERWKANENLTVCEVQRNSCGTVVHEIDNDECIILSMVTKREDLKVGHSKIRLQPEAAK